MTLDQAIEFIVAKFELLIEHTTEPQAREQIRRMASGLDALWSSPRISIRQLREMDGEMLEMFMDFGLSPQAETLIRERLVARFKTSRLRAPNQKVVRRVLSRGEIANIEEYRQVKEYVSLVDHSDDIGEENYGILSSLADTYDGPDEEDDEPEPTPIPEGKPTRRRPPPAFDLTLELDERPCPSVTPLERRVEFVRAKFARVIDGVRSLQIREVLQNQLKWGLEFAFGEHTPPESRAEILELCEHEAEYFGGYEVSGSQHRAIEMELEKEFGFRRLGHSAQVRLAQMLATDDALGRYNRMFIERFISMYPHQTLFTREQLKRAKELLKAPSPSQPPLPSKVPAWPIIPPDFSLLEVGAVFKSPHGRGDKLARVIAFDGLEVFYDVYCGDEVGWGLDAHRGMASYYRSHAALFLDGAERLRVDEPSSEFLARHRPDLPLRFGRSERLQWNEISRANRAEFEAYVRQHEPSLFDQPPLPISRLALIPRSRGGAMQRSILVTAENGRELQVVELLWQADQHQRPLKSDPTGGVGFYRSGLGKKGVPSFYIGGFVDLGGTLRWHAKSAPVP